MDTIIQILELLGAAIGGGSITALLTVRSRVKQSAAEAKASQIENIEALVEKVYKPTIETLTDQVQGLQKRVDELERENAQLRTALREVRPDLVPSRRGENGKKAPRGQGGKFAKKEAQDGK